MKTMTIGQLDPPTAKAKAISKTALNAVDIGDPNVTTIVVQT